MNHIEFIILVLLKLGLNDMKRHIDLSVRLLYFIKIYQRFGHPTASSVKTRAKILQVQLHCWPFLCWFVKPRGSAVDRTKSKVPGNAEGCGSPVIMMETHGVGRGGMIVNPKSFHPKRCWNTTKIIPKWNLKKPLKTAILVQDFEMFNKHSPGGNVGKPQDPHRLPQLTPHISKVCLPHGGEPRHIRISSNFPSACNDLIRLSSCASLSKRMDGHWDWANLNNQ